MAQSIFVFRSRTATSESASRWSVWQRPSLRPLPTTLDVLLANVFTPRRTGLFQPRIDPYRPRQRRAELFAGLQSFAVLNEVDGEAGELVAVRFDFPDDEAAGDLIAGSALAEKL